MITAIIFGTMLSFQGSETPLERPSWAAEILSTPSARSILKRVANEPLAIDGTKQSVDSGSFGEGRTPIVDPAERARVQQLTKVMKFSSYLMRHNRVGEALEYVDSVAAERPDLAGIKSSPLYADLGLLLGKTDNAFESVVRIVARPGADSEEMYLRLSLVSALRGEVFAGQGEYCRRGTIKNLAIEPEMAALVGPLKPQDPVAVAVESCIALNQPYYFELGMRLDPKNVLSARLLVQYYGYRGRFADIRRVASRIAEKLPRGGQRDFFLLKLKNLAGKSDRPDEPVQVKPNLNAEPPPELR